MNQNYTLRSLLTTTFYCTSRSQPDWHYMADGIPTVKDITGTGRSTILVDPVGLQEVWRDEGGTGKMDAAFWRIMCPAGGKRLGK